MISVQPKRMRSWLDPRTFQQTKSLRNAADAVMHQQQDCLIPLAQLKNLKLILEGVTGRERKASVMCCVSILPSLFQEISIAASGKGREPLR